MHLNGSGLKKKGEDYNHGDLSSHFLQCFQLLDRQSTNSSATESIEITLSSPLTLPVEPDTQLKVGKEQFAEAQKSDPPLVYLKMHYVR